MEVWLEIQRINNGIEKLARHPIPENAKDLIRSRRQGSLPS
jgi:hypothetical protein